MNAEAVRQLRMGLEWVFLVRGDTGSYRIIGWIVSYCRLDCIISSAGLYRIVWIRKHWPLCASWLLYGWDGWDGWTGWGIGETGVRRTDVSNRQNRSATMDVGTGAPPLALEEKRDMGSGGWHHLGWCCKDAEYLCRRSKII